ncbi:MULTISPECIES: hypothetical protein [unclassified Streptomyces]|uniref:hypothetical protein n=1 Tax=unclassified Streptomyces TaxID=2593676 RepID=UPI0022568A48|nr:MULTISPECIES: hypothetical protein [unclassified Streptomyces]WSP54204.1 hypothetical protein OG306_07260 [Streptomyces sp. NBC_01241]WSU25122.1 hypothetical protein OG508_32080 [Streptomyces sp. NBC_01108]MCX4785713.1 hypothetical protein [Streptomyces sp. NBC_01221]MCX4798429.1 hypothetical protein [Streptomyces sp. NBC_01242]WSJ39656.1 hypothetical protein OG772_29075 [Streptomyces sp. NBC_01321]
MTHVQPSARVPALWAVAYGPRHTAAVRLAARCLLRVRAFVRELALADHVPFGGY